MWLYVPSPLSASVPAEADSTSESSWQSHALARSCWWRGKRGPSQLWSRRCKNTSWLQRLCGAMSEPSTAAHGVAWWMASLAASRVSLTASLESAKAKKTSATSGRQHDASSSSHAPGGFSLRTSAAWSRRADCDEFGQTFDDLVSRLNLDCLLRKRSARRTSASAFSSSQWRTPTDDSIRGGAQSPEKRLAGGHTVNLQDQVKAWGTPTARDWKDGDTSGLDVPENGLLGRMAESWSTPRATDGEKGGPNQSFGAGGTPLPAQAQQWPTPTSLSFGESHQPGNSRSYNRTMDLASSLPDHPISTVGEESSKIRRSLNPLFVEWLMGWLRGWTLLALTPPASNACACSETELSLWKQRMRSALLQLGLPEDQPVQQRLFV